MAKPDIIYTDRNKPQEASFLKKQDGFYILLENGGRIKLTDQIVYTNREVPPVE